MTLPPLPDDYRPLIQTAIDGNIVPLIQYLEPFPSYDHDVVILAATQMGAPQTLLRQLRDYRSEVAVNEALLAQRARL